MDADELKDRTLQFALRALKVVQALEENRAPLRIQSQLVGSSTSVAANYRACCRAKSTKDFIHKMGTCVEEADETAFWLELIIKAEYLPENRISPLLAEANEITAILNASLHTAKKNQNRG